ncbi:ROK family protein [Streptosporangium sp. NBC_01639]|uniref:ROK family transcriptional regulator n=1 Tax=Streptosporangium sp. NBC_01639 TaxID=2975948 RepID=UPI0038675FEC|nr:ROK family protein [Streptosporangium sp. NBC_01639]
MRQASGDASLLRRLNSAAILRILRGREVATLTELASAAGVSRPTAEGVVEDLLADGWVEEYAEDEHADRQRGRPARRFRFRASSAHVAGVYIDSANLQAMACDLGGEVRAVRRQPLPADTPAPERLAAIAELVRLVAADAELTVADLAVVGVGTTGVVDGEGRVVKSIMLPGWTGLHLHAELSARIPVPVVVENDMRLAVMAEHWRGAARGCDDVVYLLTGDRIGMGLLIGGRAHRGAHAAAGEIGSQPNDNWSAFRYVADYAMAVEPGELRGSRQSAEFAISRARAGDEKARLAVRRFGRALAAGLITVVNPLDPEMVVVGGSLSAAGDLLVDPIQELMDEYCLYPPKVVASGLGGECITLGAVRLALDHAERLLFTMPD